MNDIQHQLITESERFGTGPDGIAVVVLTQDERTARQVAIPLARRLHPGRLIGEVLWTEAVPTGIEVVVRDLGPAK